MWTRFNNKKKQDTPMYSPPVSPGVDPLPCLLPICLSCKEINLIGRAKFHLSPLSSSVPLNRIPMLVLVFLLQIKVFKNNRCHWGCAFRLCKNAVTQFCNFVFACFRSLLMSRWQMWFILGNDCIVFHYNRLHLSHSAVSSRNHENQLMQEHLLPVSSWTCPGRYRSASAVLVMWIPVLCWDQT